MAQKVHLEWKKLFYASLSFNYISFSDKKLRKICVTGNFFFHWCVISNSIYAMCLRPFLIKVYYSTLMVKTTLYDIVLASSYTNL